MEEELEDMCNGAEWDVDDEGVDETIGAVSYAAVEAVANGGRRPNIPRKPNTNRVQQKEVWTNGYRMRDEEQLKSRVRVNRESFEFLLTEIAPSISKTPTNFQPTSIAPHRQLGINLVPVGSWMLVSGNRGRIRCLQVTCY